MSKSGAFASKSRSLFLQELNCMDMDRFTARIDEANRLRSRQKMDEAAEIYTDALSTVDHDLSRLRMHITDQVVNGAFYNAALCYYQLAMSKKGDIDEQKQQATQAIGYLQKITKLSTAHLVLLAQCQLAAGAGESVIKRACKNAEKSFKSSEAYLKTHKPDQYERLLNVMRSFDVPQETPLDEENFQDPAVPTYLPSANSSSGELLSTHAEPEEPFIVVGKRGKAKKPYFST